MEDKSNINFDDKHEMFELCQEKPIDQKILHNSTNSTSAENEENENFFDCQSDLSMESESNKDEELYSILTSFREQVEEIDDSVLDTLIARNMNDPEQVNSFIGLMENANDPIHPLIANYVKCRYDLLTTIQQLEEACSKNPKISSNTEHLMKLKNVSQKHLDSSKEIFQFIDEEDFEYELDWEVEDPQVGLAPERIEVFEHFQADGGQKCQVCMDDLEIGRSMIRLDCDGKHSMCEKCAHQWFSNHNTCHVCRKVFE